MIELRDGRYFSRFFFQDLPAFNVMGALFRDDENERRWTIIYRMRFYFRDEKVFDSKDNRVTMRDAAVDERHLPAAVKQALV